MIVRPIKANSEEWRSKAGQSAINTEMAKHAKRGTWDLDSVTELSDLLYQAGKTGEEIIDGGVHPILGSKGSERDASKLTWQELEALMKCRMVFTAPRARTNSGLDVHAMYDDISSSPVAFQSSRTNRAYAALRGFESSSRDAETAYLQALLCRPNSNDARTYVALPRQFWPEAWVKAGYRQPMVRLDYSLYGCPPSGNR